MKSEELLPFFFFGAFFGSARRALRVLELFRRADAGIFFSLFKCRLKRGLVFIFAQVEGRDGVVLVIVIDDAADTIFPGREDAALFLNNRVVVRLRHSTPPSNNGAGTIAHHTPNVDYFGLFRHASRALKR